MRDALAVLGALWSLLWLGLLAYGWIAYRHVTRDLKRLSRDAPPSRWP